MRYLVFIVTALALVSCKGSLSRVARPQLGTIVTLSFFSDVERAPDIAEAVFGEIERVESLMSPHRPGSDVSRMNRGPWPAAVSRETFGLVRRSRAISVETGGAFDITFAALSPLWDLTNKNFTPPSPAAVAAFLPLVDYRNILLDPERTSVAFGRRGMKVGMGAVAKGYAVERAIAVMKARGVESGIVEAGGDLQVIGRKGRRPWLTGLRHPRSDAILLTIDVEDGDAVATSGDYERFAMRGGRRYHHILDPRTGFPAGGGLISVTVISRSAVLSDAYATAIFVMGLDGVREFLWRHGEIDVILVDEAMKLYVSERLRERITLLEKAEVEWI